MTEILHNPSYDVLFAEETKPSLEGFEKGQVTELGAVNVMTGISVSYTHLNITRLEELRDITQAFFDNGMSMEVDLKRVNINLENLKVQYLSLIHI